MDIEEAIDRQSYRGFDLVQLREKSAKKTRWHVTQQEACMTRNYGFTSSVDEARRRIDGLLR